MFCTPQNSRKPLSIREQKLANKAEKFYLETEKRKIAYYKWKPVTDNQNSQENKRILLIHGWDCHALSFVALTKSLLDKGFEVVAFDGPAHGNSSGEQANLIDFSMNAQYIIDEIGSFYGMIGHSIGAMTIAYMMVDNLSISQNHSLERLVMISSPDQLFDLVNNFLKLMKIPALVMEGIDMEIKRLWGRPIEWYSTSNFASTIKTPLLVIHDSSDEQALLLGAERVASAAANARLLVTDKLGHYLTIRSPKVIKEILSFL